MATIMILGAGTYQVPAIVKAKEMGLRVIALSYYSDDPGLAIADQGYNISTTDKEAVLEAAKQEKIDGVMTIASELSAPTVAYVASKLGLAGIGYETARTISNKYLLRNVLAAHGIKGPRFRKIDNVNDVISFLAEIEAPIVIKPMNYSGSRGVAKIVEPSEAGEKFKECLNAMRQNNGALAEEYIEGIDIGGGCLIRNGEFVFCELTIKQLNSYFVPIAHSVPAGVDSSVSSRVKDLLHRVVKALEIADGIIDFDIRLSPNGLRIIEIGGRLSGNCIPALLEAYTGVDLVKEGIKFSLGQANEIDMYYTKKAVCSVRILGARRRGRIEQITSIEDIVPAEDIIEKSLDCGVGDRADVFDNGANRLGHVIFKSKTMAEAEERINRLDEIFVVE